MLGCRASDIEDDSQFFDLGGDSVTVLRLRAAALRHGFDLPIQLIYRCPVFNEMLQHMAHQGTELLIVQSVGYV